MQLCFRRSISSHIIRWESLTSSAATLDLSPPVVYSTDRSKAVVPVLVLLFVALWFILRGDMVYVLPCVILFLCFSVLLALRLPRLGKRELIVVPSFRTFVRFVLVWICRFPLPLGVWEGLRFVIVASPGLFSYLSLYSYFFLIKIMPVNKVINIFGSLRLVMILKAQAILRQICYFLFLI